MAFILKREMKDGKMRWTKRNVTQEEVQKMTEEIQNRKQTKKQDKQIGNNTKIILWIAGIAFAIILFISCIKCNQTHTLSEWAEHKSRTDWSGVFVSFGLSILFCFLIWGILMGGSGRIEREEKRQREIKMSKDIEEIRKKMEEKNEKTTE